MRHIYRLKKGFGVVEEALLAKRVQAGGGEVDIREGLMAAVRPRGPSGPSGRRRVKAGEEIRRRPDGKLAAGQKLFSTETQVSAEREADQRLLQPTLTDRLTRQGRTQLGSLLLC